MPKASCKWPLQYRKEHTLPAAPGKEQACATDCCRSATAAIIVQHLPRASTELGHWHKYINIIMLPHARLALSSTAACQPQHQYPACPAGHLSSPPEACGCRHWARWGGQSPRRAPWTGRRCRRQTWRPPRPACGARRGPRAPRTKRPPPRQRGRAACDSRYPIQELPFRTFQGVCSGFLCSIFRVQRLV